MNTNPGAKVILCFGDSNTWGARPVTWDRFPPNIRWTGVLQDQLGERYFVIEEGLSGRTTIYDDPKQPFRNGKSYLAACLNTHKPLDAIIFLLGTNDLKERFHIPADELGVGMEELVNVTLNENPGRDNLIKILLIVPPTIKPIKNDLYVKDGPEKSKLFAPIYKKIAEKYNNAFLDASDYIESSDYDGYHFDEAAHRKLGEVVAQKVKEILK